MSHFILTGLTGCGKVALGWALSQETGHDLIDLNFVIEEIYEELHGEELSFRDVYRQVGEREFRRLEYTAAERVADELSSESEPRIVVPGGGAMASARTRAALKSIGPVIYLRVPAEELGRRMLSGSPVAYLKGRDDPYIEFTALCQKRMSAYDKHADITIDAAEVDPWQPDRSLMDQLKEVLRAPAQKAPS